MIPIHDDSLPFITSGLPGIGGHLKQQLEDFVVEEIPAYEPSGIGDHVFLWIEKRDMGAEYFARQVARRLAVRPEEVGMAGLKDRRAVTRQWISVPKEAEARLQALEGDGIRVLKISRHGNKLRPGHLHGNRFTIRVRDCVDNAPSLIDPLLTALRNNGLPNFFGPQRFGHGGETLDTGFRLLREGKSGGRRESRFLRKLALSAVQAALFNRYLARRMQDHYLNKVLPGDVMAKWPAGGMFVVESVDAEQARLDNREIVSAGPMFGKKMFQAREVAADRENTVLEDAGLTPAAFVGFGKLLQGTRRHNLVYVTDLAATVDQRDVRLEFTLPAGSYATVLLREIMKTEAVQSADSELGISEPEA